VDSDGEGTKFTAEEDLQMKLVTMQDMFSSTRPVSVLFLRGEPEDDPDLHPVQLPGDDPDSKKLVRTNTWESRQSTSDSPGSRDSPSASSSSQATPKRKLSEMLQSTIHEEPESGFDNEQLGSRPTSYPVKKQEMDETQVKSNIFAVDVDSSYQPPREKSTRPQACFYVRSKDADKKYYRAVYLMQRTVGDLINSISQKFGIDALRVTQITHVNSRGLHIIVDEDVVRELPEGQDMIVEFAPVQGQSEQVVKREFVVSTSTEGTEDVDIPPLDAFISDPLEMWLNY
jgi:hypothetical protein